MADKRNSRSALKTDALLAVRDITVRYGKMTILDGVSFTVDAGQWLMIVGPNGAGKSTLVNAISQGVPYTGSVCFEGRDLAGIKPPVLARKIGVLAQSHSVSYSFSVEEVVKLGRYAYSAGIFSSAGEEDEKKMLAALEETGMLPFRKQSVLKLSGGELQRAFLAQVFAQDPILLILDEPTNHLDLVYQKQTFELVRAWVKDSGRAVISVVHDLSLAKAYGTHALLLDRGHTVASGKTDEVLTRANLEKAYAMDVYEWMREMLSQWE